MEWLMPVSLGVIAFGACSLLQRAAHACKRAITSGAVNNSMDWEEFRTTLEAKLAREARVQWLSAFAAKYRAENRTEEALFCLEEAEGLATNKNESPLRFRDVAW